MARKDIPLDQVGSNFSGGEEIGEKKEREKKRRMRRREKLHLLSRFPSDRTIGSGWRKRQSWSTHRELRVDIKISDFVKLQEVGVFFLLSLILV